MAGKVSNPEWLLQVEDDGKYYWKLSVAPDPDSDPVPIENEFLYLAFQLDDTFRQELEKKGLKDQLGDRSMIYFTSVQSFNDSEALNQQGAAARNGWNRDLLGADGRPYKIPITRNEFVDLVKKHATQKNLVDKLEDELAKINLKATAVEGVSLLDKDGNRQMGTAYLLDEPTIEDRGASAAQLYVRIRPDDMKLINVDCSRKEWYVRKDLLESLANETRKRTIPLAGRKPIRRVFDPPRSAAGRTTTKDAAEVPTFWVRDEHCRLYFVVPDNRTKDGKGWKGILARGIRSPGDGSSFGRSTDMPVGLVFVPVDPSDKDKLEGWVAKAKMKMEGKGKGREDNRTFEVRSAEEVKTGYRKIAVSPFNHYETWMEEADYNKYLGLYGNGQRAIPSREKVDDAEKKLAAGRPAQPSPSRLNDVKEAKQGVAQVLQDEKFKEVAVTGRTPIPEYDGEGGVIAIEVSAKKLARAEGTRESAPGQDWVMGGSATEVAKIFWPDEGGQQQVSERRNIPAGWPQPPKSQAEWLHRCAYSWGGLARAGDFKSSQIPGNLIFGTYECNSIMTRYESAWQGLVARQPRNRTKSFPFRGFLVSELLRDQYQARFGDSTNGEQPKDLKECPHWVSLAMKLTLYAPDLAATHPGFGGGGAAAGRFESVFYPFQRGFFSRFERLLDNVVLDDICRDTQGSALVHRPARDCGVAQLGEPPVKKSKMGATGGK